jgi:hypothetical protein
VRLGIFSVLLLALISASQPVEGGKKRTAKKKPAATQSDTEETSAEESAEADTSSPAPSPAPSAAGPPSSPIVAGSDLPAWVEGMVWTVKTAYRKLPIGRVGKDVKPEDVAIPGWSDPTYWSYTVKKVKRGTGGSQYLLQVRNKDGSKAAMASLYLARYPLAASGPEVLALNKGKFYTLLQGQLKPTSKDYVPMGAPSFPVLADDSLIPYDFPVLPFLPRPPTGQKSSDLTRTFAITEDLDGLKFARDVAQIEHQNTSVDSFVNKELADYLKSKAWDAPDLAMIEMKRKFDGMTVKQVWSPKLPWPVYSETATVRSWLWEYEPPKPGSTPAPTPSAKN